MLMQEFDDWRNKPGNEELMQQPITEDTFRKFFMNWRPPRESFMDGLAGLAYELYEVQICLEALLEDIENTYGA